MSRNTTGGGELSLDEAFSREHREIDAGIEEYIASTETDPRRRAVPLLGSVQALRRHIYLEEEILFPHLAGELRMPLMVMRREHGELWRRMDALVETLQAPGTAADGLDSSCRELLALLENHNSKEEPIIYPHLDTDLNESERAQARGLLADGELPSGWVCQDA